MIGCKLFFCLDLAGNRLTQLANLTHLTKLEELWCNDNQIADWKNVEVLSKSPSLKTLYLERNPLQKDPMYRKKLMLIAANLEQIDATMVH